MDDLATWFRAQLDADERATSEVQLSQLDPGYVPRRIEANRRLVELHRPANPDAVPIEGTRGWPDRPWLFCETCGSGEAYEYPTDWPCLTLRLLAAPYSTRPGYREDWRP